VDHSCFRRLTDAHRWSVVAGVTSFLVASVFVPALGSPAHAAGSRSGSPKARSASPTTRTSLSTYAAIGARGDQIAEKVKDGERPESHDFTFVSQAELPGKYHAATQEGVFPALIARQVENGVVKQAEFLIPDPEGDQFVYIDSNGDRLNDRDLAARGLNQLFIHTPNRPSPTGEAGAPEASPTSDFAGHLPAGPVKKAITRTVKNGGAKADILHHLYSNGERVFTSRDLAGELNGYNENSASDRNLLSNTLGRLVEVRLIKKIKEGGHDYYRSLPSYQALSPNEVATENARPLQDRVRDAAGRGGTTATVLEHLYRNRRTDEFASRDVHAERGKESLDRISNVLSDLADAGLIRRASRPAERNRAWYRLVEGVVLS
jgi:hypothetical protein